MRSVLATAAMVTLAACFAGQAFAQTVPAPGAEPLLSPIFTDHAVLQRNYPIAVWGAAAPGAQVAVSFDGATQTARAGRDGHWRALLPAHAAGGPFTLEASTAQDRQTISDLLVGDVYLCSGQSNMEFRTRYATNAESTLSTASDTSLRLFNVSRQTADRPQQKVVATDHWQVADSVSVGDFSAVCYFFGHNLRNAHDVPIGLIASSWGGTPIEAWMSDDALHKLGGHDAELALIALNRTNPAAARAQFETQMSAWRRTNDAGVTGGWEAADFDASAWATIVPSGDWENSGLRELANFDGLVWYRTEFTLTAAQAALGGELVLGPADDIDTTYLNGRQIGATFGWDTPRTYAISRGTLRAGRNAFASSVLDTGGGGGWWGPANEKVLRLSDGTTVALNQVWRYRIAAPLSAIAKPPLPPWGGPNVDATLYNGMLAPLAPYGLSGVLWYQGEANAAAPEEYARLLPGMMADWRTAFAAPRLPFFIVQLANYALPVAHGPQHASWGAIRDVQRRVVAADPRAALAVSIDVGDRFDIHPTQKLVVANRLALSARRMIYGEDIIDSGPTPVSAQRSGQQVIVHFAHTPLLAYSANRPLAFELCDASRACRFADATIAGDDVRVDQGPEAAAFVRYCWGDAPICNLYNDADLPAVPFELEIQ